jgi:hypothetical protein
VTSIFAEAMGPDFQRLHPMLQRRFGVGLGAGYACIGTGVMHTIRRGPWWTVPFLYLGGRRNILVPHTGRDVPFVIKNYPYRDPYGRETITFVREYRIKRRPSRFDATMVLVDGRLIDYLGTHQHLAVDLRLRAAEDGSLLLTTHGQRFYEGRIGFRFPMLFSGQATLHESYDDDAGVFRVSLEVRNRIFGFLFGYDGEFTCEFLPSTGAPAELRPRRHEART